MTTLSPCSLGYPPNCWSQKSASTGTTMVPKLFLPCGMQALNLHVCIEDSNDGHNAR